LALLAVVGLILVGLAAPAGAEFDERPYKATMSGEVFWMPDPDCLAVNPWGISTHSSASGNATHLGNVTMSSGHCTPAADSTIYAGGEMVITAANGDQLYFDYGGTCPTLDQLVVGETFSCTVDFDVVGGTGRFIRAEGSGNGLVYVDFLGLGAPSMPAWWVFEGTIGY
jgi:hypothetical protein